MGWRKGDHIAIWANNVPEWLFTQFGTGKMGGVLVTVNTNYRSFELEYLMRQSDATTLVLIGGIREADDYIKTVYNVCPELKQCEPGKLECAKLPKLKNVVLISKERQSGMFSWDDVLEMGALDFRRGRFRPGRIPWTPMMSSTCSIPRGRPDFPRASC